MLQRYAVATLATIVLLATIFTIIPQRTSVASAQGATPARVTLSSVESCVSSLRQHMAPTLSNGMPRHLTLSEARSCAPGADVLPAHQSAIARGVHLIPVGTGYAIVATGITVGSAPRISVYSCGSWTWRSDSTSFTDLPEQTTISATGYAVECYNYSNMPSNPNVGGWCGGCSFSDSVGHYDSTWGQNNYGQNWAVAWLNRTISYIHGVYNEVLFCRENIDTSANIWGWCSY